MAELWDYSRDYGIDRMFLSAEEEEAYYEYLSANVPRAYYGWMFEFKVESYCELFDFPDESCGHFQWLDGTQRDYKDAGVWSTIMSLPDSELLDNDAMRSYM